MSTVLCVDDEPLVLSALQRILRGNFQLITVGSGEEALAHLAKDARIQVALVDFRMPHMDGLTLLEQVRQRHPRVIRMMLTGEADMRVALGAVNRGEVFRFLTKPAERDQLRAAITAALRQYQLEAAERELLERTVTGSIRLLIDLLGLADASGMPQSTELRQLVRRVARSLSCNEAWAAELAAVLERIGALTLPMPLRNKLQRGSALDDTEQAMADGVVEVSAGLLEKVPRLELVAKLLREAHSPAPAGGVSDGAAILRICSGILQNRRQQQGLHSSFAALRAAGDRYVCPLLKAVEDVVRSQGTERDAVYELSLPPEEVLVGDRLLEDLYTTEDRLLCAAKSVIGESLMQRIHNYVRLGMLSGVVRVERLRSSG